MHTFYETTAKPLDQAARLLLGEALLGIEVRDAHVAYFYRQSFEVIFRVLATHPEANSLVAAARRAIEQGAAKQVANVIMLMQVDLVGDFDGQDHGEGLRRAEAREQAVEATRARLGNDWPTGAFPNYWDLIATFRPRTMPC